MIILMQIQREALDGSKVVVQSQEDVSQQQEEGAYHDPNTFLDGETNLRGTATDRSSLQKACLWIVVVLSCIFFARLWLKEGQLSPITVHLVAHSHDDVGWLKTVDDYFYGGNSNIQRAGVQYTIDTVLSQLNQHPEYKFIIVQMAFLYRWWRQASPKQQNRMKDLVAKGQLQFVNAGWCASDEATTYYQDFVDNMVVGLRWLKQTLGYIPSVAWHIDPFGHQAATASLFSQMGFKALFFSRLDYQEKWKRLNEKSLQFLWKPVQLSGNNESIFTQIIYNHYSPPPNFYFETNTLGPVDVYPIIDDPTSPRYNVEERANQFINFFREMAQYVPNQNLMHTIGEDFTYMNARMQFKNFEKLVKYINSRPELNITFKFSTPEDYLQALYQENRQYPTKNDDFMPYADNQHSFWTGYFTSRPSFKGFVRDLSRYLHAARKHLAELKIKVSPYLSQNSEAVEQAIFQMEMALGIFQHHDAISGTAKQKVNDDYVHTGIKALSVFNQVYKEVKKEEILKEVKEEVEDLYFNVFWNETGDVTGLSNKLNEGKTVLVSLYNPGSQGTYPIRLRVPPLNLNLVGHDNSLIPGDIFCGDLKAPKDCELWFHLSIGESSNAYVKISPLQDGNVRVMPLQKIVAQEESLDLGLREELSTVVFHAKNASFTLKFKQRSENLQLSYNYYEGWDSDGQTSGAYIFRPKSENPKVYSPISQIYYTEGVTHLFFVFEGESVLSRVYFSKAKDYVEKYGFMIESQLDSVPVEDGVGKEVTLNLKTGLKNGRTFYTDSMGLEEQKRELNYRPTWDISLYESTTCNYYPVNSFLRIVDKEWSNRSVTVMTDRSQGGSVLREGEIELMIHRRLVVDDYRGVSQALNEKEENGLGIKVTVRHYVVLSEFYRQVQKWNDQRILPTFGISDKPNFQDISIAPPPIKVPQFVKLNIRPYRGEFYLIRVHNMDPLNWAEVDLGKEWVLEETTLAFNQLASEAARAQFHWKATGNEDDGKQAVAQPVLEKEGEEGKIVLKQFEMKTFKGRLQ